jgi:hypothetical protein
MGALADGLALPAPALAFLGWPVPRPLAPVFPEGVLLLALASAALMLLLGMAVLAALHRWQGVPWSALLEAGRGGLVRHVLWLGSISALIWAPVLLLWVAGLPRRRTGATW